MFWDDDRWGRWQMHDTDGSGWALMMLFMVILVIAVAVLLAVLLRPAHYAKPAPPAPDSDSEAMRILRRRFAAGEIDEEEFRSRSAALSETSGT